ncbi:MAG: hypothetical protein EXS55_04570 [Candidatus Magasanikbacteria bacterium]|nr:hypothetical protein [Candidatus Magasanikbacteria bacterium]
MKRNSPATMRRELGGSRGAMDFSHPHVFVYREGKYKGADVLTTNATEFDEGETVEMLIERLKFQLSPDEVRCVTAAYRPEGDEWVKVETPTKDTPLQSGYLYDVDQDLEV